MKIRIAGPCWIDIAGEIARFGLAGVVDVLGRMPHGWVLQEMSQTGVLLMIGAADMDVHSLSTKIFEYLAARRPILAIVPEGPIATLMRRMEAGTVAPPDRPDLIAEAISALVAEHRRAGLPLCPPCDLGPYTRRAQAAQLAGLLNRAVDSPRLKRPRRGRPRAPASLTTAPNSAG